jgi:release factor glutamine methyltransferase
MAEANPLPHTGEGVRAALAAAAASFAAFSETPRLDAELLMAHALGITREALLLGGLDRPTPDAFEALAARRLAHEPIAYITGTRAFWTIDLAVGPGALVPRADSETLIEAAVGHFGARMPATILDLGTGPGTLLLAALDQWPEARGLGVDASETALALARTNAARLGIGDRATFRIGDWAAGIDQRFDLVLANPPYIGTSEILPREVAEHEPASALFAGPDGLDAYRAIAPQLRAILSSQGVAVIEIGSTQAVPVSKLLVDQGLNVAVRKDLGGRDRALIVT